MDTKNTGRNCKGTNVENEEGQLIFFIFVRLHSGVPLETLYPLISSCKVLLSLR